MEKKGLYKIIIEQITGIFLPIISYLTAASILKSVVVILASLGVLDEAGGVYMIFYAVSDGFFYFLPFLLAITASKQWKTDLFISVLIPITMLYPDITAVLENGNSLSFMGLTIPATIYHSSVIPVLFGVGLLYFVEKPCNKIHESVRGFLKPIICCLIVLPCTFLLFGPLGTWIGDILTKIFFVIYDWNPVVAGAFMGFVMQPMVVVGAHWSVVPVSINNILTRGYDVIMPLVGGAVYAQAGAALAVGIMAKKNKQQRQAAYQGALSAALGVTEPALFGVTVPILPAMLCACSAGAIGGAIAGVAGTHCTSFAFPSYLTCIAYVGPGFVLFLLSMGISGVLSFIFTMLMKKKIEKYL